MPEQWIRPRFLIGDIVEHVRNGRPWEIDAIWPWADCMDRGEWRYTLVRPRGFMERLKAKARARGVLIRALKTCNGWEGELRQVSRKVYFQVRPPAPPKRTSGGIIVPAHYRERTV